MTDADNFDPIIGAHFSVAGGLENALNQASRLDCKAVQIFTKNARSWKEPELTDTQIRRFATARQASGVMYVFSHCSYLINVASDDPEKRQRSAGALKHEMLRSGKLGLDGVVLHPGAHLGRGMQEGIASAVQCLDGVLKTDDGSFPRLLIETTAGSGTTIGGQFEEIRDLIQGIGASKAKLGVCLDTSHIFAAGYDIRTVSALETSLKQFDATIGLSRLHLIHANDSIPELASRKDRHQHIGMGNIGLAGFEAVMNHPALAPIPKILETPKEKDGQAMDPVNLALLKDLTHKPIDNRV